MTGDVLTIKEITNTATGSLKDSAAADIACDARVRISYNGTTYYIALYDTVV